MTRWWQQSRIFMIFVILVLCIGGALRFINLGHKVYWHDEAVTSFRMSGYNGSELQAQLAHQPVLSLTELHHYQRPNPKRGLGGVIWSLRSENSQHPPLYYGALYYWAQAWGNSIAHLRLLSVVFNLMALPALYWLCQELFALPLVGWLAMALMAVSPLQFLYAQEARPYSLWLLLITLATAALLRALRVRTKTAWMVYAGLVAAMLYTFLFSLLVLLGHALYVVLLPEGRRCWRAYAGAAGASLLAFSPWLFIVLSQLETVQATTRWTHAPTPLGRLVGYWGGNIGNLFFDWGALPTIQMTCIAVLFVGLSGYALWVLCRSTPPRVWGLIVILMVMVPLVTVLPDLSTGGFRSAIARYFMPSYLGLGIGVAHCLALGIHQSQQLSKLLWRGLAVVLLSIGLASCLHLLPAQAWWNKGLGSAKLQTAALINQYSQPLVLSSNAPHLVALSYLLTPKTHYQLVFDPERAQIPSGFEPIFIFRPSDHLQEQLLEDTTFKIHKLNRSLWQLQRS